MYINDSHEKFFIDGDENQKIWRYMDLPKFIAMIMSQSLYFPRIDLLGDPSEGKITKSDMDELIRKLSTDDLKTVLGSLKGAISANYISCWHVNENESAAMWSIYLQQDKGIAVQSTVKRLKESLDPQDPSHVRLGQVKYIDRETQAAGTDNGFSPVLKKGKFYEYEKEIRAVYWMAEHPTPQETYQQIIAGKYDLSPGVSHKCDLNTLIEKIVISPKSPGWFEDMITSLLSAYKYDNLKSKVVKSSMLETYF